MSAPKLSPMMRQYQDIRRGLPPNTLLFFRLGDFYEMFFDDAREASVLLNVALTKRGGTPMCGVPCHSARAYVAKLVEAGKRVAICDQVGDVTPGKLVRREIARILSAGTLDDFGLEENRHNYLAAVCPDKKSTGLAWLDLSTGEFRLAEIESPAQLADQIARLQPSELLVPDHLDTVPAFPLPATPHDAFAFELNQATDLLLEHFRVQSLDGFGCTGLPNGARAAGALLHYITRSLRRDAQHLAPPKPWHASSYLLLDAVTQTNLELVESRSPEGTSLRGAVDRTLTPMGSRLLREWILHPLRDLAVITHRQDLVAGFHDDPTRLAAVRDILRDIRDMERAVSRLSMSSGNARDLVALKTSLALLPSLRTAVLAELASLQHAARAVAEIDTLSGLAETARTFRYIRPKLTATGVIKITDGRHPVLDQTMPAGRFVPNDTALDTDGHHLVILTGPNMAGKSTYIRQVALLVLLAQTGSFIPAAQAEIGIVDRIFTRVGATDDLARGQSTFMVEMNETAAILNNATDRSLVILDEIGRGTSTFDGLSIAWSVAEHLHDVTACRTLFATHYHELTDLARTRPGVANCNIAVREWNDDIIFLRKIIPGPADQSYGIQVARLAGLPEPILKRAREILANLENSELTAEGKPALAEKRPRSHKLRAFTDQLDLFES